MIRIYRFSPIDTKEALLEAISYIVSQTTKLCRNITGTEFPISGLTVFSHYPSEFEHLTKLVLQLGKLDHKHNGPYVNLYQSIAMPNNSLKLLRIRHPDPYRLHVGCNDFEVGDFQIFKKQFLEANPNNLRLIKRPDYEMIEFFDPDYDVLAYVVSK